MKKLLALALFLAPLSASRDDDAVDWASVVTRDAPVTRPAPLDELEWRGDLSRALDEATRTGRPLFVTLRCLPCKQCAQFDKDVFERGAALSPLLRQFVTVRLTTMREVDRRLLPYATDVRLRAARAARRSTQDCARTT